MDAEVLENLRSLCGLETANKSDATALLDLIAEFIMNEYENMTDDERYVCSDLFISSIAYQLDTTHSRDLVISWLMEMDLMETHGLGFIGRVLVNDLRRCSSHLHSSPRALGVVTEIIWTYRFTQPSLVRMYLEILYEYFARAQVDADILNNHVSEGFVKHLYRVVSDNEEDDSEHHHYVVQRGDANGAPVKEALLVLVALNDQYMLHDLRNEQNKVFHALEQSPIQYISIGGALVWQFNRCDTDNQTLKICIAKFFYLIFTNKATAELLYTNDLSVLAEVLIRELDDLPIDAVDVRAMYLRVLYVMTKYSTIGQVSPELRTVLVEMLQLTIRNTENLDSDEDKQEIKRLAERCLAVKWLTKEEPLCQTETIELINGEALKAANGDIDDITEILSLAVESASSDDNSILSGDSEIDVQRSTTSLSAIMEMPTFAVTPPALPPQRTPRRLPSPSPRPHRINDLHHTCLKSNDHNNPLPPIPRGVMTPVASPSAPPRPLPRCSRSSSRSLSRPPPPPASRNQSISSIASVESGRSLEAVDHLRPAPPPLPRKRG